MLELERDGEFTMHDGNTMYRLTADGCVGIFSDTNIVFISEKKKQKGKYLVRHAHLYDPEQDYVSPAIINDQVVWSSMHFLKNVYDKSGERIYVDAHGYEQNTDWTYVKKTLVKFADHWAFDINRGFFKKVDDRWQEVPYKKDM